MWEARRNDEIAIRFEGRYVRVVERHPAPKTPALVAPSVEEHAAAPGANPKTRARSKWMDGFFEKPAPSLKQAIKISNASH